MKEGVIIRRMIKADIEHISQAFIHQGWPGREDILTSYFQEQENRERDVLVAESDGFVAGYITILPAAKHGPFVGVYPELPDFNVFEPFRNRGIGNQLLEEAEKRVRLLSEIVTLGVGLHSGYGPAQRPVSYTHLDVYKRQLLCRTRCLSDNHPSKLSPCGKGRDRPLPS